ncbi:unnamed protein product, partial [Ectocarpus sp. 12 AP-2014]
SWNPQGGGGDAGFQTAPQQPLGIGGLGTNGGSGGGGFMPAPAPAPKPGLDGIDAFSIQGFNKDK